MIKSIDCKSLCIPFKSAFKHHTATRDQTASVWLRVESACGCVGYGESCPRPYVTGESVKSALAYIHEIKGPVQERISTLDDLRTWIRDEQAEIDKHPAAYCALELALLDLFGKIQSQSVEHLLGLPELAGDFTYSAVLGDSSLPTFEAQLRNYQQLGLKDLKIKVSGDVVADKEKFALVSSVLKSGDASTYKLRLDANNLWDEPADAIDYLQLLDAPIWAIEEPVKVGDYAGMRKIAQALKLKIILDESLLKESDLSSLKQDPALWIVNVRISKMGGIVRSLAVANGAVAAGHELIIGAQVGESSLLSRAALTVAQSMKENLLAQEGAFGLYLLEEDVVAEPLMFGLGGVLKTDERGFAQKHGFGLGIKDMSSFFKG